MIPKRLKKGDTIGIVAPSNPILEHKKVFIENGIDYLKSLGFNVIFSKNAFAINKYGYAAGTPEQRADDINAMFKDKNIAAIWCAQGGDNANDVLDLLDYDLIKKNPKIFLGKSDIDVLLLAINTMTGLITFHCPDPKIGKDHSQAELDPEYTKKWLKQRLINGKIGPIEKSSEWKCLRKGKAEGKILGCNLSSLSKLTGTKYFPDFKDAILFLEVYDSDIRVVFYKLTQLKNSGVFDKIKGIVVGYAYGFQDKERFDKKPKVDKEGNKVLFENLVLEATENYSFPILKINEFGHYFTHLFLPIGGRIKMDADNLSLEITEKCVD